MASPCSRLRVATAASTPDRGGLAKALSRDLHGALAHGAGIAEEVCHALRQHGVQDGGIVIARAGHAFGQRFQPAQLAGKRFHVGTARGQRLIGADAQIGEGAAGDGRRIGGRVAHELQHHPVPALQHGLGALARIVGRSRPGKHKHHRAERDAATQAIHEQATPPNKRRHVNTSGGGGARWGRWVAGRVSSAVSGKRKGCCWDSTGESSRPVHWSFDRSAMAAFFFEKLRVAPDVWLCSDGMRANGAHRWAQRNGASSPYGIGLDCKNAASL